MQFYEDYETDKVLSESLKTHDWYFLPVFNVDGYDFTWVQGENVIYMYYDLLYFFNAILICGKINVQNNVFTAVISNSKCAKQIICDLARNNE